jgi:dephospho-CoA kinase
MKNLFKASVFVIVLLLIPLMSKANNDTIEVVPREVSVEAKILNDRLLTIKSMDKSSMRYSEKRELRKEVKRIKANLAQLNGGVYLTTGAIIIIILLLILLL